MWRGQTVAILASGPSMSQAVADRVGEAKVCVVAVNTTVKLAPWADMLYAADDFWIVKYEKLAAGFAGLKVISPKLQSHFSIIKKIMSAISTRYARYRMIQTSLTDKFINPHFL